MLMEERCAFLYSHIYTPTIPTLYFIMNVYCIVDMCIIYRCVQYVPIIKMFEANSTEDKRHEGSVSSRNYGFSKIN